MLTSRKSPSFRAHNKVHAFFPVRTRALPVTQCDPKSTCPSPSCPMPQPHLPHAPAIDTQPHTNDPIQGHNEGPWGLLMVALLILGLFSLWDHVPQSFALLPTSGIFSLWGPVPRSIALLPTSGILSLWGQAPRSIALPPTSGISSLWRSTMLLPTLRDLTCSQSMCILSSFLFNFLMAHLCRRQMAHLCLSSRPCMSLPLSESRALAFRHAL